MTYSEPNQLNKLSELLNPLTSKTDPQKIQIIGLFLLISWAYQLLTNWQLTWLILNDSEAWDFSIFLYLFPITVSPIAGIALIKINKLGWVLLTFLLFAMLTSTITSLIFEIRWLNTYDSGMDSQLFSTIDEAFGSVGIEYLIIRLIVIGLVLYFINLSKILSLFAVSSRTQSITIGTALGIFGLINFSTLI